MYRAVGLFVRVSTGHLPSLLSSVNLVLEMKNASMLRQQRFRVSGSCCEVYFLVEGSEGRAA